MDLMNWYYSEQALYFPGILHEPTHRIIRRIMKRGGKKLTSTYNHKREIKRKFWSMPSMINSFTTNIYIFSRYSSFLEMNE